MLCNSLNSAATLTLFVALLLNTIPMCVAFCSTVPQLPSLSTGSSTNVRDHRTTSPKTAVHSRHPYPTSRTLLRESGRSMSCKGNDHTSAGRPSSVSIEGQQEQELVLREFSMALQSSPAAYERRVRSECLRSGGDSASVVRWHISYADAQSGRAHLEVHLSSVGNAIFDNHHRVSSMCSDARTAHCQLITSTEQSKSETTLTCIRNSHLNPVHQ